MTTMERQASGTVYALDGAIVSPELEAALARGVAATKDSRAMTATERQEYVTTICRALRLNPLTNPVQFITLNGREVLYVTRTATDQLAAMHSLNRRTIRGPEIIDVCGVKIAICVVEVTLPNGRSETATATLPVADHANLFMKLETKAKRRGTLSILGLGMLAEDELETIPDSVKGVPLTITPEPEAPPREKRARDARSAEVATAQIAAPPPATETTATGLSAASQLRLDLMEQAGRCDTVEAVRDLWLASKADVARVITDKDERAVVWQVFTKRVATLRGTDDAAGKAWLTNAVAPPTQTTTDTGSLAPANATTTAEIAVAADDWRATPESREAHVETLATYDAVMACARAEHSVVGLAPLLKRRLMVVAMMGEDAANNEVNVAMRKAREAAQRGPHDDGPTSGGGAAGGSQGSATRATGNGASSKGGAHTAARAQLSDFVQHIAAKPRVRDPQDTRAHTQSLSEIAMSYLKRREEFASAGIADAALDALRDELRGRGVVDTDAFLAGVIANMRRRTPTTTEHRAADRMAA